MKQQPERLPSQWRILDRIFAALVGIQALTLSWYLWQQWKVNPDLSHGFVAILLSALLIREARAHGPHRYLPSHPVVTAVQLLFALGGLAGLVVGGLFAVSLDWSNTLVFFVVTAANVLLGAAAWLHFSRAEIRVVPFCYAAGIALVLWVLVAPLPPGTYSRLTLGLQTAVTEAVLNTLHVLGIPAQQRGNLIELSRTVVGVEEACSGIRSLISCVFAGLFFSAWKIRRPMRRLLVVGIAGPLAVLMNYFRSLFLTLLANAEVDISGFWHDVTGFGILVVTAGLLAILAMGLEGGPDRSRLSTPVSAGAVVPQTSSGILLGGYGIAAALTLFFVLQTRPGASQIEPPPEIAELLPDSWPGWQTVTQEDLYRFSRTLQTNHLLQRTYLGSVDDKAVQVTFYIAYWTPGQAPVSLVSSHTPDACWPGVGWDLEPGSSTRAPPPLSQLELPPAEYRLFKRDEYPQHVWFWHLYDREVMEPNDPRSPSELLRLAVQYGFRSQGDQFFVRVSSNQPWDVLSRVDLVENIFARMQAIGL